MRVFRAAAMRVFRAVAASFMAVLHGFDPVRRREWEQRMDGRPWR